LTPIIPSLRSHSAGAQVRATQTYGDAARRRPKVNIQDLGISGRINATLIPASSRKNAIKSKHDESTPCEVSRPTIPHRNGKKDGYQLDKKATRGLARLWLTKSTIFVFSDETARPSGLR